MSIAGALGLVAVLVAGAGAVLVAFKVLRMIDRSGERRGESVEQARQLQAAAERERRGDEIAAQDLTGDPGRVADGWAQYRDERLRTLQGTDRR